MREINDALVLINRALRNGSVQLSDLESLRRILQNEDMEIDHIPASEIQQHVHGTTPQPADVSFLAVRKGHILICNNARGMAFSIFEPDGSPELRKVRVAIDGGEYTIDRTLWKVQGWANLGFDTP